MTPPPLQQTKAPGSLSSCLLYIGVFAIAFFLVFFAAGVITYVMPKKYESTAVLQVKPPTRIGVALGGASAITPQFFATECEVIRSQDTLKLVVQQLSLKTRWNMTEEEAIAILRGIVNVQNIRNTDLIAITVKHTSAEDARNIAQEVYEAYKKRREEKDREMREAGLKELEAAVEDQSELMAEKRKKRDQQLRNAPDLVIDSNAEALHPSDFVKSLNSMREIIAIERANAKGLSLVELHEEPVIAQYPSSPNVTLNLLLGAVVGLILGLLSALFLRLFAGRRIS